MSVVRAFHTAALIALLVAAPLYARAADRFVSSSASGANDGTSWANAWQSVAAINQGSLSPGDVVYVAVGTGASYGEINVTADGTDDTVGDRIWFIGVSSGAQQPILSDITESGSSFIGFVNFEITGSDGAAVELTGATGWLFADMYIHNVGTAYDFDRNTTNSYVIVRGGSIENLSLSETQSETGGHHILFEYLIGLEVAGDFVTNFAGFFGLRNCYLNGIDDIQGQTSLHIDAVQTFAAGPHTLQTERIMVDGNFLLDWDEPDMHFLQLRDEAGFGTLKGPIARFNVVWDMTGYGHQQRMTDDYVYNNTFQINSPFGYAVNWDGSTGQSANNSFTQSTSNIDAEIFEVGGGGSLTQRATHEYLSGNPSGTGNIENTPAGFTNQGALDFTLGASSPLIGQGVAQTFANGSGTDTVTLVVDDARWFCDGWDLFEGDLISIGGGPWIRIADLNEGTNTITLATPDTWSDNDPVRLFGSQDISALHYRPNGYTLSGTLSIAGTTCTVTANDSDLCRMVIFYENGVPQDPDYDAPYTYTSSGGAVTAKLYARFASQTPVVVAALDAGPVATGYQVLAP